MLEHTQVRIAKAKAEKWEHESILATIHSNAFVVRPEAPWSDSCFKRRAEWTGS